jgi:hypothetical protein
LYKENKSIGNCTFPICVVTRKAMDIREYGKRGSIPWWMAVIHFVILLGGFGFVIYRYIEKVKKKAP